MNRLALLGGVLAVPVHAPLRAQDPSEEARFLTSAQKRAIFHDNATRFLRLTPEAIARHHGRDR